MVNHMDVGQNGLLEADKLMFTDNSPGPEKIEVVMGRCFPLTGPGSDYNLIPIPVVRQIVYKNSDGATFTQTFGDLINSENQNYKIPTSVIQQHFDPEKKDSKNYVKDEASDSNRSGGIISSLPIIDNQGTAGYKEYPNNTLHISKKDVSHMNHENAAHNRPIGAIHQPPSPVDKENPFKKEFEKAPDLKVQGSRLSHTSEPLTPGPTEHVQNADTISCKPKQISHRDQSQKKIQALPIDSEVIKRISSANSPRFKVKHVEPPKSPEISGRKAWEETQKKKAQLREEFFQVPYEECNREAIRGMGGRLNKSEPKLNTIAKERKKRNSMLEKRRVHFNMDDSQLEEMRKWREERRMQATPHCIKTVARIYSLDAPSNQRQVEYITSYNTPKSQVPVTTLLPDSPPMSTRIARPTDLDSLQGNFATKRGDSYTMNFNGNCDNSKGQRTLPMQQNNHESILSTPSTSNSSTQNQRLDVKVDPILSSNSSIRTSSTADCELVTKSRLPSSHSEPQDLSKCRTQHGIQRTLQSPSYGYLQEPTNPINGILRINPQDNQTSKSSQPLSDNAVSLMNIEKHSGVQGNSQKQDAFVDSQQQRQLQQMQYQQQQRQQQQIQYQEQQRQQQQIQYQQMQQQKMQQHQQQQQTQQQKMQHQQQQAQQMHFSHPKPQHRNISDRLSVRPKDFSPHVLQPVPSPRSKSLTSKGSSSSTSSTPLEQQNSTTTSRPFASKRATSLDRATIRKRTNQPVDFGHSLKSPGLILSHLRSPNQVSDTRNVELEEKMENNKENRAFSPFIHTQTTQKTPTNVQHSQSSFTKPVAKPFNADSTPAPTKGEPQRPVNIIRSYTYPKHSSVTALHKGHHQDEEILVHSNLGYTKHQMQHFKPLNNSSNVPINQRTPPNSQFSKNYENASNTRVPHDTFNTENKRKSHSRKTSPNGKGNSVNIMMTKGESYAKHHIVLSSHMTSANPRVTVRKIIVPVSSASIPVRSAPSPTPSCASSSCSFGSSGSSSGCFSGSPSPTPTPSPTRTRASGVPTDL